MKLFCVLSCVLVRLNWLSVYHLQEHISNWIFYKSFSSSYFAPNSKSFSLLFQRNLHFMCFFVKCLHLQLCASVTAARHYYCHCISLFIVFRSSHLHCCWKNHYSLRLHLFLQVQCALCIASIVIHPMN